MTIQPRDVTPEIAIAVAALRTFAQATNFNSLNRVSQEAARAIDTLDNCGLFAAVDEATEYASAEEILKAAEDAKIPNTLDPAEWGDTTSADMTRRQYTDDDLLRDMKIGADMSERIRIEMRRSEH